MLCKDIFNRYFALPARRGFKVQGAEDVISHAYAAWLREQYLGGHLNAVFFHVPNEGKMTMQAALLRKWIGVVSGAPDWVILGQGKGLAIELKTQAGRQSLNQKAFEEWCKLAGVQYHVCFSLEEAQSITRTTFSF